VDDLKEEFARDFIFPMLQASALYENQYFLGTSIARPLIAKRMVEIAQTENAAAVAHGATGKGNDQVRFELTVASLAPEIQVIAPWRLDGFREKFPGRAELIRYAEDHDIPVTASAKKPYSSDRNLLHISFESGVLEDPWYDATGPELHDMYKLSVSPEDAPDVSDYLELEFDRGDCIALAHKELSELLGRVGFKGEIVTTSEGRVLLSPLWVMKVPKWHWARRHG
jgi:argininosuccinate synthase